MGLSERQKEIINASLDIIGVSGIQALTIKNISKKVGISEPAIYRHFSSKTQILLTILDFFVVNNNQILNYENTVGKSVKDIIELMFVNFIRTFTTHPNLISVVFSEEIFRNDEIFKAKSSQIINGNLNMITKIINKGQQTGEVKTNIDAQNLALIIMGSLRLFVKQWQMAEYNFDLKQEGEKLKETILTIILK